MTIQERIEAVWLEMDGDVTPMDIAMALIDEDVSRGEYEGCSVELELAASEYAGAAERMGV